MSLQETPNGSRPTSGLEAILSSAGVTIWSRQAKTTAAHHPTWIPASGNDRGWESSITKGSGGVESDTSRILRTFESEPSRITGLCEGPDYFTLFESGSKLILIHLNRYGTCPASLRLLSATMSFGRHLSDCPGDTLIRRAVIHVRTVCSRFWARTITVSGPAKVPRVTFGIATIALL